MYKMNIGDLVRINCRGPRETWAYRGTKFSHSHSPGAYLPDGTVGLNLGPSDPRFPKFEPLAILIEGEIWTLPTSHLEPITQETL